MINHIYNGKINNDTKIFILENNVNIVDMEYVWLNYFSKMGSSDYKCLNRDFNTGSRFLSCGYNGVIRNKHIEGTTYYNYCKNGIIEDTTNLIDVDDEIILLQPEKINCWDVRPSADIFFIFLFYDWKWL